MNIEQIAVALHGKKSGKGYQCKCPAHEDDTASLSLATGDKGVVFYCHAGCAKTSVIDALKERGLWNGAKKPADMTTNKGRIIATYDYTDATGKLVQQALRYDPKGFSQRRPDGAGGWIWTKAETPVPYKLPQLLKAIAAGETIYVAEGEKDVENIAKLGVTATCNAGGAGKWGSEHSAYLKDATVVILPDNDDPGRDHAKKVVASLAGIAAEIKIVELPGLPPKGDVSDWLAAGGTRENLDNLVTDKAKTATRTAVDGAELLNSVHDFLARFIAFPSPACLDAVTLWAAHTHMIEHFHTTPRLAALSPEAESGKTRILEILNLLTPNSMLIFSPSAASIFRKLAQEQVTLLFDEVDTIFTYHGKNDQNEDVRALLNSGYRRGAAIPRCVGPKHEVQDFKVFAATALAGIGDLPDTVMTRSIIIRMRRRSPAEHIEQYRVRVNDGEGHELRDRLAQWAESVGPAAGSAWPDLPDGVVDRRAEAWEPLIAVADAAGGNWPERARVAAVADVAEHRGREPTLGIRLLMDLRVVFADRDVLSTKEILETLNAMEDAPWGDLRGKPLDDRGLARRLKKYEVFSKVVRIGTATPRGYTREDLYDSWVRYLGSHPLGSATSATPETDTVVEVEI